MGDGFKGDSMLSNLIDQVAACLKGIQFIALDLSGKADTPGWNKYDEIKEEAAYALCRMEAMKETIQKIG